MSCIGGLCSPGPQAFVSVRSSTFNTALLEKTSWNPIWAIGSQPRKVIVRPPFDCTPRIRTSPGQKPNEYRDVLGGLGVTFTTLTRSYLKQGCHTIAISGHYDPETEGNSEESPNTDEASPREDWCSHCAETRQMPHQLIWMDRETRSIDKNLARPRRNQGIIDAWVRGCISELLED